MKIAVLSNINLLPIKRFFSECYVAEYGQYVREIFNRDSTIWKENFDVVWLHLELEPFLSDLQSDPEEFIFRILENLEEFLKVKNRTLTIMSNFSEPIYHSQNYFRQNLLELLVEKLNAKLKELTLNFSNFLILRFSQVLSKVGWKNLFAENFWYAGRIRYSYYGMESLALEVKRLYRAYRGMTKKVLVLDLDNTLWGGVIGEDGIDGILLSEEGKGKIYRDFQKNIGTLKDLGILLCIVSKNNYYDVEEVFEKHPLMVLKLDDFIIKKINWKPKHENVKEIAEELNLSLDSFVFIDDSPFEREEIRKFLPEVAVPEFPRDVTNLNSWFWEKVVYEYFPKLSVTREDKEKTEQYKRNIKRKELQSKAVSYEDFLKSLQIELKIYTDDWRFKTRLAQLTQKTNQFNLTTRRYTESDIASFLADPKIVVYALEYRDVFGSEGIVGEAIVKIEGEVSFIDTFLMSCRVMGRNVEYKFIKFILEDLKSRGVRKVYAEYIPTKRNICVKDFYRKAGFLEVSNNKFVKELSNEGDKE